MDFKNSRKSLILLSVLTIVLLFLLAIFVFLIFTKSNSKISQTGSDFISANSAITSNSVENTSEDSPNILGTSTAEKSIFIVDEILLKLSVVEEDKNDVSENNSTISTKSNNNQSTTNNKSSSTKVTSSNGKPYYIKVNYTANVVTVYKLDDEGNYTVPVKAMVCSTGTSTPRSGKYRLGGKYRWISLFGGVYGQYATQIVGNILFHSVPYKAKYDPSSLEYWEYDKLGTACSMGCIRLSVIDAKWIYDNVARGTYVEFYSDSDPGPLGKPGTRKISSNVDYRGWDPTDPDSNNPWRNMVTETPVAPQPEPTPAPTPTPATTNTTSNTTTVNSNTSTNNTVTNSNTSTNTSTGNTSKDNSTSTNNTNTSKNNNTSTNNTNTSKNNNTSTNNTNTSKNNNTSTHNTNTNKNTSTSNTNITNNSNTSTNTNITNISKTSTNTNSTKNNNTSNNNTNSTF